MSGELKMVTNEPLVLKNDGKTRAEDDLIAHYTWNEFRPGRRRRVAGPLVRW